LLTFLAFACVLFAEAINFNCSFAHLKWSHFDNEYTCTATIQPSFEDNSLQLVFGQHQGNHSNSDVRGLSIRDQNLQVIPRNLASFFRNLLEIELINTKLRSISNEEFRPITNLRAFYSVSNPLEFLSGDLFSRNARMTYLGFKHNRIAQVGADFLSAHFLYSLDFTGNVCINKSEDNIHKMRRFIREIRSLCSPACVTSLAPEVTTFEPEVISVNTEETTAEINTTEQSTCKPCVTEQGCEDGKADRELKHQKLMKVIRAQDEKIDKLIRMIREIYKDVQEIKDPFGLSCE
jgi:hypothetical protein